MGYRGKVEEQERARVLRARNMTLQDIATELGVSRSSVSLWVRDAQALQAFQRRPDVEDRFRARANDGPVPAADPTQPTRPSSCRSRNSTRREWLVSAP